MNDLSIVRTPAHRWRMREVIREMLVLLQVRGASASAREIVAAVSSGEVVVAQPPSIATVTVVMHNIDSFIHALLDAMRRIVLL